VSVVEASIILCDHGTGFRRCRQQFQHRGSPEGVRVIAAISGWRTIADYDYCPDHAALYLPSMPDDT
jgi:hypothetical protein